MIKNKLNHPVKMPEPVSSEIYTRDYFTEDNSGFQIWKDSNGFILEDRHRYSLAISKLSSADIVLDYGCGRGEIVLHSALRGAKVFGVDYSQAAVDLARETIQNAGLSAIDKVQILKVDEKQLPFADATFTKIFFLDIIEHLTPGENSQIFSEFFRVLKPGGEVIIHTSPNRLYYDNYYPRFTYPLSKLIDRVLEKIRGRGFYNLPRDPRTPTDRMVHINEQDLTSIKAVLQEAGFSYRVWASDYLVKGIRSNPKYVISRLFIRPSFFPLNIWFANNIWAIARKSI